MSRQLRALLVLSSVISGATVLTASARVAGPSAVSVALPGLDDIDHGCIQITALSFDTRRYADWSPEDFDRAASRRPPDLIVLACDTDDRRGREVIDALRSGPWHDIGEWHSFDTYARVDVLEEQVIRATYYVSQHGLLSDKTHPDVILEHRDGAAWIRRLVERAMETLPDEARDVAK